jgi:hypothetical protein
MTAKPRIIATISVLMVASWVILLVSAFLIFEVVVPLEVPGDASYLVKVLYEAGKAILGAAILGIWFYSFYLLRDSYARVTGLTGTPTSSSSRQRPDGSRKA